MEEKIIIKSFKDVPIASVSLQSTLWNKTGEWRTMHPNHVSLQAPCSKACPIEQDIPFYLTSLAEGKPEEAWERILELNPFPAVCGRVCHHPCEEACNRGEYDGVLSVHALERFLGDWGIKHGSPNILKTNGSREKIAIIGAGPAGLSCAYFLARKGYVVKVFEAMSEPGGMLRYAIPRYRLPRGILNKEIERIESLGVEIQTAKNFGVDFGIQDVKSFSAVFFATGAHKEQNPSIAGDNLVGVWHGLAFLKEINCGKRIFLGKRVIVVGGGNTAIDSARVASRMGSKVTVLYRRSKEEMPAISAEVDLASEEDVGFIFNALPFKILGKGGKVRRVECLRTRPGRLDESGRRAPIPIKGSNFSLPAESSILALGERADLSFLPETMKTGNGLIITDSWGRTNLPGTFAGGDAATGEGYVSHAIASGKRSAMVIDRYLRGESMDPIGKPQEVVRFEKINLNYFPQMPKVEVPVLVAKDRVRGFREVYRSLSELKAREEAERCFSCGHCIRCNVCLMFCPDVAISYNEKTKEYAINYDYCKGCGICTVECPCSCMILEEEKWSE